MASFWMSATPDEVKGKFKPLWKHVGAESGLELLHGVMNCVEGMRERLSGRKVLIRVRVPPGKVGKVVPSGLGGDGKAVMAKFFRLGELDFSDLNALGDLLEEKALSWVEAAGEIEAAE